MYLSELKIWNFRKFGSIKEGDKPGLYLAFRPGFNLLVGENDSGKSAIIDAIRLVLLTQSREFISLDYDDFNTSDSSDEDQRSNTFKIECIFRDLKPPEAKNFLEWLDFEEDGNRKNRYYFRVFLIAKREHRRIYYDIRAGPNEGKLIDSRARDLLRVTYLKPLRDAEYELYPRKNSRLSQILDSHQAFSDKDDHIVLNAVCRANEMIEQYFKGLNEKGEEISDQQGKQLLEEINSYLIDFSDKSNNLYCDFSISDVKLKAVLERLGLDLTASKAGLGSHNLLFISTELLLLHRKEYDGLKLALIEEIEAHLHPQAQLRLIECLQKKASELEVQLILTSHSPNLASKVKLDNLIICKEGKVFPMGNEYTKLEKGDYLFLERFLDVTKANMFFAQGIILVEGDAENMLVPAIAEIINLPLSKYGVSIINISSTAFLRYSKIFQRVSSTDLMGIPVACITDCDVKPNIYKTVDETADTVMNYPEGIKGEIERKELLYNGQGVKTFVSPWWTLEYVVALSSLKEEFYKAILYAKAIQNSDKYVLTDEKVSAINTKVRTDFSNWISIGNNAEHIAFKIYHDTMLKNNISKAIVAQCFSKILREEAEKSIVKGKLESDSNLKYIVDAVRYVTENNTR